VGKPYSTVTKWSSWHNWPERIAEYERKIIETSLGPTFPRIIQAHRVVWDFRCREIELIKRESTFADKEENELTAKEKKELGTIRKEREWLEGKARVFARFDKGVYDLPTARSLSTSSARSTGEGKRKRYDGSPREHGEGGGLCIFGLKEVDMKNVIWLCCPSCLRQARRWPPRF